MDDAIRFESVSDSGTISATHLVIKRIHGDEGVVFDKTYSSSSIVYKLSEVSGLHFILISLINGIGGIRSI